MKPLLRVEDLSVYFPVKAGLFRKTVAHVHAVDKVNFSVRKGETLGVVGESGCGKTTLGRALCRLVPISAGHFHIDGINVEAESKSDLKKFRRTVQMVFQDPYSSLNPRMSVKQILEEPLRIHFDFSAVRRDEIIIETLEKVGLNAEHRHRFPHQFSGGQRQRIGIARALMVKPSLVICDEAVSALDVSVQAQILNLLGDLQKEDELTYIFISHDLSVVQHISNRVMIMYLGRVVEMADTLDIFTNPLHPYTQALLSSIPIPDPTQRKSILAMEGDVPSASQIHVGCRFQSRCRFAMDICRKVDPSFKKKDKDKDHFVACHLHA